MMRIKVRLAYIVATCFILVAGLSTRIFSKSLPHFVVEHFGDALWAAMIYCVIRVILIKKSIEWSLLLSIMFCIVIEVSQLYQADWINAIRGNVLGGLILGKGFLYIDLVRYAIGILVMYLVDKGIYLMRNGSLR
ncbi:ribosomal maturation YjgA family protein [Paenibacillus sp. IITD108]|uniref:ribosomal maturation YjgA family protein n=1 Tax=Paenibacillus sp. IITD108 TaxID=3116649 RepID=UPI002F3E5504